jgi:hypothetical protein
MKAKKKIGEESVRDRDRKKKPEGGGKRERGKRYGEECGRGMRKGWGVTRGTGASREGEKRGRHGKERGREKENRSGI